MPERKGVGGVLRLFARCFFVQGEVQDSKIKR